MISSAVFLCLIAEVTFKVHESRYKQCEVVPQFSTRQNLLKKILRNDKWQKLLKKISKDKY